MLNFTKIFQLHFYNNLELLQIPLCFNPLNEHNNTVLKVTIKLHLSNENCQRQQTRQFPNIEWIPESGQASFGLVLSLA